MGFTRGTLTQAQNFNDNRYLIKADLGDTQTVLGDVAFSGDVAFTGGVTFSSTVAFTGGVTFSSTVDFTGVVTFGDDVTFNDVVTFNENVTVNANMIFEDDAYIGITSDTDLLQLSIGILKVNGDIQIDDSRFIGIDSDTDMLQLTTSCFNVNNNICIDGTGDLIRLDKSSVLQGFISTPSGLMTGGGSGIGIRAETGFDTWISEGVTPRFKIQSGGNIVVNDNIYLGIEGDTDLLQLLIGIFKVSGNVQINDNAYIGITTDTDLLQLKLSELIINATQVTLNDNAYIGTGSDTDMVQFTTSCFNINNNICIDGTGDLMSIKKSGVQQGYISTPSGLMTGGSSGVGIRAETGFEVWFSIGATPRFKIQTDRAILPDNAYIGVESDTDLLQLTNTGYLLVNGSITINDTSYIGIDSSQFLIQLTTTAIIFNTTQFRLDSNAYIGTDANNFLLQLISGAIVVDGNVQINDNAYIGTDSDTDMVQLTTSRLNVNNNIGIDGTGDLISIKKSGALQGYISTPSGIMTGGSSGIGIRAESGTDFWISEGTTPRIRVESGGEIWIPADDQPIIFGGGQDMSVYYTGTVGVIDTSLVAASDLDIQCGTDKTLELQESVYDDIQFPVSSARVPASNFPTWATFTSNTKEYIFSVNDYIDCQANEIRHSWKVGTAVDVHAHLTIPNATVATNYIKLTVYFAYADDAEVWTETSLTAEKTIASGTAGMTHFFLSLGSVTLTNNLIGTQIKVRVVRIAATGGTEYPYGVFITQIGSHAEVNTIGSRTPSTK